MSSFIGSSSKRDSSMVPGTVYLITSTGEILRLPVPANSPHDPLNWTNTKRLGALLALSFFGSISLVVEQGASTMFYALSKDFKMADTQPFDLTVLATAPIMCMGFGALIWIPLSLALGRRPVILMASMMLLLATIWASAAVNFFHLLAAVCLQGVAAGVTTSAILLMVIDLTFIHERPTAIASMWGITGALGFAIVTIAPQGNSTSVGWRFFYRVWIIPSMVAFLLLFFFFPETYFIRPAQALDGRILVQSATEKVYLYEDLDEVPEDGEESAASERTSWKHKVKNLKFWGTTRGGCRAMIACYPQILLCLINPLIFWVALLQAMVVGSLITTGETYALILGNAPHHLSVNQIALFNLAGGVGALISWPVSAYTITAVSRQLTRRNKGVCDAEHYLPAFVLPVLTAAAAIALFGFAAELQWHWSCIYISSALSSFAFVALGTASTLWITEAFPRWAGPALAITAGVTYGMSFAISFVTIPWLESQGFKNMSGQIAIIILVVGLVGVPISFWGKQLRQHIHGRWAVSEAGALRPSSVVMHPI